MVAIRTTAIIQTDIRMWPYFISISDRSRWYGTLCTVLKVSLLHPSLICDTRMILNSFIRKVAKFHTPPSHFLKVIFSEGMIWLLFLLSGSLCSYFALKIYSMLHPQGLRSLPWEFQILHEAALNL